MAKLAEPIIRTDHFPSSRLASREFSPMTWQRFTGSDVEWDQIVTQLHNSSPYQSSAWATFRSLEGWTPIRLITVHRDAAVQALTRRAFGIGVAWVPGGPLGETSSEELGNLCKILRQQLSSTFTYVRVADFRAATPTRSDHYVRTHWRRPRRPLSSGHTLTRTLLNDGEYLRSSYTKNWARNLRRGEERGVSASVWSSPDSMEIAHLHQSVAETKGIPVRDWRTDSSRLAHLFDTFRHQIVVVRATDSHGVTQAIRGAVVCGTTGFDFLAATSSDGRKSYASNVALHHLLEVLAQRNVTTYDFGGVDSVTNKGVYDFKHGAGGHEHSYVGEFENTYPRAVRSVLSTLIALRLAN